MRMMLCGKSSLGQRWLLRRAAASISWKCSALAWYIGLLVGPAADTKMPACIRHAQLHASSPYAVRHCKLHHQ